MVFKRKIQFQGSALVTVLIFCFIVIILANSSLFSSLMQIKMVNSYKANLISFSQAQNTLSQIEKTLAEGKTQALPPNVTLLQFVPDTIHFLETQGVNYYRIQVNHSNPGGTYTKLISTYAIRNQINPFENIPDIDFDLPRECVKSTYSQFKTRADQWYDALVCSDHILFYDHTTHQIVRKIPTNIIQVQSPQLIITDSSQAGFADYLYYADKSGILIKIDLKNLDPSYWQLIYHCKISENMIQIVIGRNHKSGAMIYIMAEKNQSPVIEAYWDDNQYFPTLLFRLESRQYLSKFLLRQGSLIVASNDAVPKINIFDAQRGISKCTRQIAMDFSGEFDFSNLPELKVLMKKPIEEESEIAIYYQNKKVTSSFDLEYQKLGRRVFEEWRI